jgi:two-component system, NarL family, nitrate/nitrite response regulator NarL
MWALPLSHITVVCASPLLGQGLMAALAAEPSWVVGDDTSAAADVWVLYGDTTSPPQGVPTVMLADQAPPHAAPQALLRTSATPAQLRAAVAAVLQGLCVRQGTAPFGPAWTGSSADHEPLTPRELEVFELVAKGLSNRDIAGVLAISAHTAKFHVSQILAKVGAATRAEAVSSGLKLGLIGL